MALSLSQLKKPLSYLGIAAHLDEWCEDGGEDCAEAGLVGHEGGVAQEQRLPPAVPAAVRGQAHVARHQPLVVRVARVPD